MNRTLEFRPDARAEFDEAADWYEDQKPGLRHEFIHAVDATLSKIVTLPLAFPIVQVQQFDEPWFASFHTRSCFPLTTS